MYNVHLLPAAYGDAILIEYGKTTSRYILVDGGPYYNFDELMKGIKRVAPQLKTLELLVITHIDIDHIDGIVTLLNQNKLPFKIKEIWFNGYDQIDEFGDTLGALQGEYVSNLIKEKVLPHNTRFGGEAIFVESYDHLPVIPVTGGMEITLLSPGGEALKKLHDTWKKEIKKYGQDPDFAKKLGDDPRYEDESGILGDLSIEQLQEVKVTPDRSVPNRSSIAFIATYDAKSCLFAGDATSDALLSAIDPILRKSGKEKLKLHAWKLSHHGSKKSTVEKLIQKMDCPKILVSSNGANFKHPDDECIGKLIFHKSSKLQFYFNYKTEHNERWSDTSLQAEHGFKSYYPKKNDGSGISIKLS